MRALRRAVKKDDNRDVITELQAAAEFSNLDGIWRWRFAIVQTRFIQSAQTINF